MKKSKPLLAAVFALIIAVALVRAFARSRHDPPGQNAEQAANNTATQVSVENGETVIKLNAQAQALAGIATARLEPARERKQVTAPATVLGIESLVNLSTQYAAGRAALQKAQNNLSVSRREYARLKKLYADQQNASAKDLEAAKGRFQNDQTDVAAARRNLAMQISTARQAWGGTVAQWLADNSPALQRVLDRQTLLVQVTLPPGEISHAPPSVMLGLPSGARAKARRVSAFPRVDPRIQGMSFLYQTRARDELAPGLNLVAHLATGPRLAGVIVPESAVVWWRGQTWAYLQTASGEFTRRPVSTRFPVEGGYFVTQGFAAGERIVRAGAQMLLSEESKAQNQGGGEEGDTD